MANKKIKNLWLSISGLIFNTCLSLCLGTSYELILETSHEKSYESQKYRFILHLSKIKKLFKITFYVFCPFLYPKQQQKFYVFLLKKKTSCEKRY